MGVRARTRNLPGDRSQRAKVPPGSRRPPRLPRRRRKTVGRRPTRMPLRSNPNPSRAHSATRSTTAAISAPLEKPQNGIAGLKQELLRHPDLIVSTVAEKMLMFAVGRNLQHYDTPAVRKIVKDAAAKGNTMQALILGVVDSPPFLMREVQGTQPATKQ